MLKFKIKNSLSSFIAFAALVGLVTYALAVQSGAQPAFSQGYKADGPVQSGMIVRLVEDDSSKIEPLSAKDMDHMLGVVVNPNDAPVTLSDKGDKVFVATQGKFDALVSNQAGKIKPGDYITISSLNGIGMKAGNEDPVVLGRALETFNEKSKLIGSQKIKDSLGGEDEVKISMILVNVSIARSPLFRGEEPNVPEALRKASEAIAGKEVAAHRIYVALIVFSITSLISIILLYGGIRSGIISVGRNPLSKKSIFRGMVRVIIAGLLVFIVGVFGVYLLLKL